MVPLHLQSILYRYVRKPTDIQLDKRAYQLQYFAKVLGVKQQFRHFAMTKNVKFSFTT